MKTIANLTPAGSLGKIYNSAIDALIDSVPEEAYGVVLLSESMREERKRLLRKRLEEGILPLL